MLKPGKNELRKPTRTISGITPVAIMLPPRTCEHGNCLYCPSLNVPQSYTPKSPVVMRAAQVNYNATEQVRGRLRAFRAMNHPTEKIELIIMGGTFLEYPKEFQYEFIKNCYEGLNGKKSKTLAEAKRINETAKHRCVALCIETRPDVCINYIDRLLEFGCTRVELGVQIIDDEIYKKVKRGHKVQNVIDATHALKNAGFKIGYHIMPGLPGSDAKKDLKLFKKIFLDERFKPDQLKIYPCQVMPGSELEKIYWKGKYKPYTKEETQRILIQMLKVVPRYCRVMRIMREIPPEYLVAGTTKIDLRKDVEEELRAGKTKIKEIRFREVGFANKEDLNQELKLRVTKYGASKGKEYFLEIVNKDNILFGLLRLRVFEGNEISSFQNHSQLSDSKLTPSSFSFHKDVKAKIQAKQKLSSMIREQSECKSGKRAIIRELHVYGRAIDLGKKGKIQHQGLGRWLMDEAEKIVRKEKIKELAVISGVGVREYYRKLGYKLEGDYMVRKLS